MTKIRILPRTLNRRIFLVIFLVVLLFAGSQLTLIMKLWPKGEQERLQRLNWGLASSVARQLLPIAESGGELRELAVACSKFKDINPEVDIFFLNEEGEVLIPNIAKGFKVPVDQLEEALAPKPSRSLPIYGPHPLHRDAKEQVFSVSRFRWRDIRGYLYVPLVSLRSFSTRVAMMNFYIIYGGVIATAFFALLFLLLGALLAYFVTRRFRILADTVEKISQGDLDLRIPFSGNDEVGQLGRQINDMTDTIVSSLQKTEENDRLRRDLVANISHDLRGPVTSLNGYVEETVEQFALLSEDEKITKLQVVLKNGRRLARLIDQLFELSKLDAKEAQPECEPFSILDIITEEIIPKYAVLAKEKSITLSEELPNQLPRVAADFQMIYRVLSNLVQNAVSYTQVGGTVSIRATHTTEKIQISVSDNGPGIPEKDLEHIFDRFYIPSKARTKGTYGSGLGLAIVKKILDTHTESVRVESLEGAGTTFTFTLAPCKEDL